MSNYTLASNDILSWHGLGRIFKVRDGETDEHELLRAQIASGDYFITLATQLDQISQTIQQAHPAEYTTLEQVITDLIHLQNNYTISKH